jgi:hypothetical protein
MTFVANDETEFLRYLNFTQPSLSVNFTPGSGATAQQVQVTCSKVQYNTGKLEKGDSFTQISAQFDAIANSTDAGPSGVLSPCKVITQCALPAGSYS